MPALPLRSTFWCVWSLLLLPSLLPAQTADARSVERDILKQLVEINTSDSARQTDLAAKAMAERLAAAGIPRSDISIIETTPGIFNLVARYRGRAAGARPILLMAHIDVVGARREDWSFDPFAFREADGYYYGRGSSDNKAGAATLVALLIRYKQENFVPERDVLIALTGDEETTGEGIQGLLEKHRELVDAEFALNTDAGGGELRDGKPVAFTVQTAEKVYLTFQLEVRNKGGHSSVPEADNAIYRLSNGLVRLARFTFPVRLNETTRATFTQSAATYPRQLGADMRAVARSGDPAAARRLSAAAPYYNAQLRTTCVATRLFGGHADNALPQLARATVNCRLLPDHAPDSAEATLRRVLGDTAIHITRDRPPMLSPSSPLRPDVMGPVESLVRQMWPGAIVVPEMSTGASDGLYVRNAGIPVYGVSAVFERIDDIRAHGRDGRIGVKAYHDAARFWYDLVRQLASTPPSSP
jgi:acetylornithine deacetylase/succinyl-diaminopimelate desuccinylase-like protein